MNFFDILSLLGGVALFLFGMTLLINTYAYTRVDMKYGTIIDAFTCRLRILQCMAIPINMVNFRLKV